MRQRKISTELRHQSTTDAEGRYRLRDIPRRGIAGEELAFEIIAVKEGFADHVSLPVDLKENANEKLQVVDPIRMSLGVAVSVMVIDHLGKPTPGVHVLNRKALRYRGLLARS